MATRKRRSTHVPRTRLVWRKPELLANLVVALAIVLVLVTAALVLDAKLAPAESLPRCTDAIADAGGSCEGEPLPACPTEDSTDCYWDGGANGLGRSFVSEHGVITYTD